MKFGQCDLLEMFWSNFFGRRNNVKNTSFVLCKGQSSDNDLQNHVVSSNNI